ncbi:MAG TPA: glycosyltransferase family 2 protein [bacterium]|jgi:glycosyltransferase involved in cell wall biosynthesis
MKNPEHLLADANEVRTQEDWGADLSIVVPVKDEVDSLPQLYEELCAVMAGLDLRSEVLFVDDGSTDGSPELIERWTERDPTVGLIRLRGNFGKAAALAAGFQHCRGRFIITLDSDLQDDPREIPHFLTCLAEGYDLVSGWKQERKDPHSKIFFSKIYNFLARRLTGVKLHDCNCGFKAYRRELVEELDLYGQFHRWIPALATWKHFRVGEVPVRHRARLYGTSKYGVGRLFRGLFDLITITFFLRYLHTPNHFFGAAGLGFTLLGVGAEAAAVTQMIQGAADSGGTLLVMGLILIVSGLLFIGLGLVAEMHIFSLGDRRRAYSIQERRLPYNLTTTPMHLHKRY